MEKVIVVIGPTSVGKTKMGVALAKKFNGEVISGDSMQIYKQMDIGTAKVTEEEKEGIIHHCVDILNSDETYSVHDFQQTVRKKITEITQRGHVPIIVGGTGLYVDSLIYGIEYPNIEFDENYRKELERRVEKEGLEKLYEKAKKIDPQAMKKISRNDQKRILRVLEIYNATGKTKTEQEIESRKNEVKYDYRVFAINMDREKLYERINIRVDRMLENGLIEEVENLQKKYNHFPTAMQGLGYKEVVEYLQSQITREEMIEKIKQESRRYAKRQLTWFRKNKQTIWIDGLANLKDNINIIEKELNK